MVDREVCTEGSGTTKSGTDEQGEDESLSPVLWGGYRGHLGRVSKHTIAMPLTNNPFLVDAAGIGGRNTLLPGGLDVKKSLGKAF